MRVYLVLLTLFCCALSLESLERRPEALNLKTSILIPCYYKHFQFIPDLLKCYAEQTVTPNEVVISLQQYKLVPAESISKVLDQIWPFSLKIVFDEGGTIGANRNNAAFNSSGDLLITQDADDIPHPQRVELIKHLFDHFYVEFLMHRFDYGGHPPVKYSLQEIEELTSCFDKWEQFSWDYAHNGNIACARHVLDTVQWSNSSYGEDVDFNCRVYLHHKYKVGVFAYLVTYRPQLSSSRSP